MSGSVKGARVAESLLAAVAAGTCLATAIAFSGDVPLFPLPGLYLIEIALAGAMSFFAIVWRDDRTVLWEAVPWIAAGILAAFTVLGIWSVGVFLVPATLALLLAGTIADRRRGANKISHGVAFLISAGIQATIVWVVFTSR
jgi:hypothetical protein